MKKTVLLGFVSVLLLMSMFCIRVGVTVDALTTRHVYPGQSIQEAIDLAQLGDTVFVHAGTYYELLVMNKSVVLIGESEGSTIIDGNDTGNVISVIANNVKIRGFTIRNSGLYFYGILLNHSGGNNISHNIITNNYYGIRLRHSNSNILIGNVVSSNKGVGIWLADSSNNNFLKGNTATNNSHGISIFESSNNTLTGNTVSSNRADGISVYSSDNNFLTANKVSSNQRYGICFESFCHNSVLTDNAVTNNYYCGITITLSIGSILTGNNVSSNTGWGIHLRSDGCILTNNTIINNGRGIVLQSSNNTLTGNIVSSNNQSGIELLDAFNTLIGNTVSNNQYGITLQTMKSTIYHNNFINNNQQVRADSGIEISEEWKNVWDDGSVGNYWSDYGGVDYDGDGVGDQPYVINEYNRDNHPLMSPWSPTWRPVPLWMRWWLWTIILAGITILAVAVYFLKKRKPPTPTTSPPLQKDTGTLHNL